MQTTQDSTFGIGMVILDEFVTNANFLKSFLVVAFKEKSAVISKDFGLKDQSTWLAGQLAGLPTSG